MKSLCRFVPPARNCCFSRCVRSGHAAKLDARDRLHRESGAGTGGVSPSAPIAATSTSLGTIRDNPSTYTDFLLTMGEDSGYLHPFGDSQVYLSSDGAMAAEDPIGGSKIAYRSDQFAVAFLDTYLDASRSDGNDASIVMFETPVSGRVDFGGVALVRRTVMYLLGARGVASGVGQSSSSTAGLGGAREKDAPARAAGTDRTRVGPPELARRVPVPGLASSVAVSL